MKSVNFMLSYDIWYPLLTETLPAIFDSDSLEFANKSLTNKIWVDVKLHVLCQVYKDITNEIS